MLRLKSRSSTNRGRQSLARGGFLLSELPLMLVVFAVLAAVILLATSEEPAGASSTLTGVRPVRNMTVVGSNERFVVVLTDFDCHAHDLTEDRVLPLWWRQDDDRITAIAGSTTQPRLLLCSHAGVATLIDIVSGAPLWSIDAEAGLPLSATFSRDGRQIAIGTEYEGIVVLDAETGRPHCRIPTEAGVSGLSFSADGQQIIAAESRETVTVWNLATGRIDRRLDGAVENVSSVAVSPDGTSVAAATCVGVTHVWNLETGRQTQTLGQENQPSLTVAWSPEDGSLLRGSMTGDITETGGRNVVDRRWMAHDYGVRELAFARGCLVSAGYDGGVRLWDVSRTAIRDLESGTSLSPR